MCRLNLSMVLAEEARAASNMAWRVIFGSNVNHNGIFRFSGRKKMMTSLKS